MLALVGYQLCLDNDILHERCLVGYQLCLDNDILHERCLVGYQLCLDNDILHEICLVGYQLCLDNDILHERCLVGNRVFMIRSNHLLHLFHIVSSKSIKRRVINLSILKHGIYQFVLLLL